MSKIQDLIDELCPNGVEYKFIGDSHVSTNIFSGGTPKTSISRYWEKGTIPWMSSGEVNKGVVSSTEKFITSDGLAESSAKIVPAGSVVIALAGQGKTRGTVARTTIELSTNQSLAAIVPSKNILTKFLYYYLSTQYENLRRVSSGEGTRGGLNLSMIKAYTIPVPPLKIQEEIVRILDSFTLLEAELEAELEARRKQYAHYRDSLLFSDKIKYNYLNLSEVGVISTGKTPSKLESSAWSEGINFVTPSDIRNGQKYISSSERTVDKEWVFNKNWKVVKDNSILVTCIGADMGKAVIPTQESVFNQQINSIEVSDNVDIEYLYYWLVSRREYMLRLGRKNGSTMPILNKTNFSKIVVNLPELWLQRKISKQISVFDALVNDISSGLPAEIAARRKQYEYYRDQLLTFKELKPASA